MRPWGAAPNNFSAGDFLWNTLGDPLSRLPPCCEDPRPLFPITRQFLGASLREDDCLAALSRLAAKSAPSAPSIPLAALPWARRLGAEPVHRSSMDLARARVTRAPHPCPACVAAAFAREKDFSSRHAPSSLPHMFLLGRHTQHMPLSVPIQLEAPAIAR